jgi:hypothetical protein
MELVELRRPGNASGGSEGQAAAEAAEKAIIDSLAVGSDELSIMDVYDSHLKKNFRPSRKAFRSRACVILAFLAVLTALFGGLSYLLTYFVTHGETGAGLGPTLPESAGSGQADIRKKTGSLCTYGSHLVPCYYWHDGFFVGEYQLGPFMMRGSSHEIAQSTDGKLWVTQQMSGALTALKIDPENPVTGTEVWPHYVRPLDGPHQILWSRIYTNVSYITLEFSNTIAAYDSERGVVLARFVIPVANGTPHTLVEDGHGHVYFALKV